MVENNGLNPETAMDYVVPQNHDNGIFSKVHFIGSGNKKVF
jgi:hypothetical protein